MSAPRVGDLLQTLTGTHVRLAGRALPAYQSCGYVGFALAVPLSLALVAMQGLSCGVMAMIVVAAVVSVIGQAIVTTLLRGEEDLVYYRHIAAIVVVGGALSWALGEPPLPYLDATIMAVPSTTIASSHAASTSWIGKSRTPTRCAGNPAAV